MGEAFRDFSETLGKALEPALIGATKGLTALIKAADDLFKSPLGKTAAIFSGIALAAKGIPVLLAAVSAGLMKVAAAGGIATIALNAIPFVALATAAGIFTTALIKTNDAKKKFNKLVNEGAEDEVTQALKDQAKVVGDLQKKVDQAGGRQKKHLNRKLQEAKLDAKMLEGRLQTVKSDELINEKLKERLTLQQDNKEKINETNNAANAFNQTLDKSIFILDEAVNETDRLKEKFMEIGQGIEQGIVSNLTDAVMGTQTLAQAAMKVLED